MADGKQKLKTIVRRVGRRRAVAAGVTALIAILAVAFAMRRTDRDDSHVLTHTVRRGPLTISLTEEGSIRARDQVIIKSEVQGSARILFLIPEGAVVKPGDLLVELDASKMEESRFDQQLKVKNAEAEFIRVRENMAVTENQAQSDEEKAVLTLDFAGRDMNQYTAGEYPKELKEVEARIRLAEEDGQRAAEKLKWSRVLFDEKYISQTELQADELAEKKARLDLELAQGGLELLTAFTHDRRLAELESNLRQATLALDRTRRKNKANILQAEAELSAREIDFKRQQERLTELENQILKTRMTAPSEGLVVYATSVRQGRWSSQDEPLAEGQDARERQELIYLPETARMMASLKIHESRLDKLRLGMKARVMIDALPGRVFGGEVARIAPLPDPTSAWINPDLKVYDTQVHIDGDGSELRNGMTCKVEILIDAFDGVLSVPVQCVVREGRQSVAYVAGPTGPVRRPIEVGADNTRMILVTSGLAEGEEVVMTPPLSATARPEGGNGEGDGAQTPRTRGGDGERPAAAPAPNGGTAGAPPILRETAP